MNANKNSKLNNIEGKEMINIAKELFPHVRTIMGPGIRLSFSYFKNIHKEFKEIIFKTGEKVFDWVIPQEWDIKDAYLEHENGNKFAKFLDSNLHIVQHSEPKNIYLQKEELIKKIYISESQPNAIPYCTSYYKKDWGFCMDKNTFEKLPEGKYKVYIDSTLKDGELHLLEAYLNGSKSEEIFFSSYLCHPSMANNELSGPVLLNQILTYIKQIYPNRKYSYRFVLLPETIGSIAYLSKNLESLKNNVICGFNLSCVGDERSYSHIESRSGNTLADKALLASISHLPNFKNYSFLERGSDERQYCFPGIDLPLCCFSRSKFGEYPEYHTSLDNFDVITEKGLQESFEVMKTIVDAFELGLYPSVKTYCEPHLSSRGLYPTLSKVKVGYNPEALRKNILAYSDSNFSLFDLSLKFKVDLKNIIKEINLLKKYNLISIK